MKRKNILEVFVLVVFFLGVFTLRAYAKDLIDPVGLKYLEMLQNYCDQIQKTKKDIEVNWQFWHLAWTREERNRYYAEHERLKLQLKSLRQEPQKLELDALKYYKGKLPQLFKTKWDEIMEEVFKSERPDYSKPPYSQNKEE